MTSGVAAGCSFTGTWTVGGPYLTVDIPTDPDRCETEGPGAAATEIRRRLTRVDRFVLEGSRLTLLDDHEGGVPALVYERSMDGSTWSPIRSP